MSQSTTHARRASGALLLILCVAALCALPWLLPRASWSPRCRC